jgi:hypothetical protein
VAAYFADLDRAKHDRFAVFNTYPASEQFWCSDHDRGFKRNYEEPIGSANVDSAHPRPVNGVDFYAHQHNGIDGVDSRVGRHLIDGVRGFDDSARFIDDSSKHHVDHSFWAHHDGCDLLQDRFG